MKSIKAVIGLGDRRSEGRGANRNTIGLVGITQADESVKGE